MIFSAVLDVGLWGTNCGIPGVSHDIPNTDEVIIADLGGKFKVRDVFKKIRDLGAIYILHALYM